MNPANEHKDPTAEHREWRSLFRGVWTDRVENGDLLPVGGGAMSEDLNIFLRLDFETFGPEIGRVNAEQMRAAFEARRSDVVGWLEQVGPKEKIDPFLFFVCGSIQARMEALLEVREDDQHDSGRTFRYGSAEPPALSEFRGKAMCVERTYMAQYLLQQAGFKASSVVGSTMDNAKDQDEDPSPHGYIILEDPVDPSTTYVYDAARPLEGNRLPRILKTDVAMTYGLLEGEREVYVRATEVLQGGELWFGVGESIQGEHDIIEVRKE